MYLAWKRSNGAKLEKKYKTIFENVSTYNLMNKYIFQ